jgi:hypothetical protein
MNFVADRALRAHGRPAFYIKGLLGFFKRDNLIQV